MKENFLTIPDASNYKINSQLVCRNKRTGAILSLCTERRRDKWKISYVDQHPAEVDWNMHGLGALARRQQKLEATS